MTTKFMGILTLNIRLLNKAIVVLSNRFV